MLRILFRNLLCTLKVGFRKKFIFMMLVPLVYLPTLAYASFQDAVDIEITKVEYHDFYERFVVVGQSRAENSKTYYAKTAGTIDSIAITQGQEVKKGDVLLTIDLEIAEATKQVGNSVLWLHVQQSQRALYQHAVDLVIHLRKVRWLERHGHAKLG